MIMAFYWLGSLLDSREAMPRGIVIIIPRDQILDGTQ
jgi:hypothetical protein